MNGPSYWPADKTVGSLFSLSVLFNLLRRRLCTRRNTHTQFSPSGKGRKGGRGRHWTTFSAL